MAATPDSIGSNGSASASASSDHAYTQVTRAIERLSLERGIAHNEDKVQEAATELSAVVESVLAQWRRDSLSIGEIASHQEGAASAELSDVERRHLHELVQKHATLGPLRELLKQYRVFSKDRITLGGTLQDVLTKVFAANLQGVIPDGALISYLAKSEENGHQHVFLFRPREPQLRLLLEQPRLIVEQLLGKRSPSDFGLPRFLLQPLGVQVSDFRSERSEVADYRAWVFKAYYGTIKEKRSDPQPMAPTDEGYERLQVIITKIPVRGILLAKWHSYGVLEIRLPSDLVSSLDQYKKAMEEIWCLLAPAVSRSWFEPVDLEPALLSLVKDAASGRGEYTIGRKRLLTAAGNATEHQPKVADEDLSKDKDLQQNAESAIGCTLAVVRWTVSSDEAIRTVVGNFASNGYFVSGEASAQAIDFITRRLIERLSGPGKSKLIQPLGSDRTLGAIVSPLGEYIAGRSFEDEHQRTQWTQLHSYIEMNRGQRFLDPAEFAEAVRRRGINALEVARLLADVSKLGLIRLVYKVRPRLDYTFLAEEYARIADVPEVMTDDLNRKIARSDSEVVPLYVVKESTT